MIKSTLIVLVAIIAGQANAFCLPPREGHRDPLGQMFEYMECLIAEQATALKKQANIISLMDDQLYEMRIKVLELENEVARAHNRIDDLEE